MAKVQPLRIFFGQFVPNTSSPYASLGDSNDDQSYPSFLTGMFLAGTTSALHSRKPVMLPGFIHDWDEYLDLKSASVEPTHGTKLSVFEDVIGTEHIVLWDNEDDADGMPTNQYQIEAWANEFLHPTRRLSLPYPRPDCAQPSAFWHGDNTDMSDDFSVKRMYVVLWKSSDLSVYSSPANGLDVAINSPSGGNQTIRIQNDNSFTCKYSIYMCDRELDAITGAYENSAFPKAITGHHQTGSIAAGAYADVSVDVEGATYVANAWMEAPALNDAIARVRFDFDNHATLALNGDLKHEVLVLNAATHSYFKGLIVQVNPLFTDGVPRRTEDSAVITLQVTEEGSWANEAWTNPNGILATRSSGTVTTYGGWTGCIDSLADFVSDGVQAGDRITNITKNFVTTVVRVVDLHTLEVVGAPSVYWEVNDDYLVEYVARQTLFPRLRKVINE